MEFYFNSPSRGMDGLPAHALAEIRCEFSYLATLKINLKAGKNDREKKNCLIGDVPQSRSSVGSDVPSVVVFPEELRNKSSLRNISLEELTSNHTARPFLTSSLGSSSKTWPSQTYNDFGFGGPQKDFISPVRYMIMRVSILNRWRRCYGSSMYPSSC